jgi:Cys-rich protein (TIGR01571 family)
MSFKESLFGCCDDMGSCCLVYCCPMTCLCLQAVAAGKVRNESCFKPYYIVCCLGAIGGAVNRERIREALNYGNDFWGDFVIWMNCARCAACQEYREVSRHFDRHNSVSHHHGHDKP